MKNLQTSSDDRERVHALVAGTSSSPSFIIDSGASRHMVSTRESFSLDASNGLKFVLGGDSETECKGKGRIHLGHGSFNNVLYVPGLATNLFTVY